MSEPGADYAWLRERVWALQGQVAAGEAKIEALGHADGQHREEIQSLRVEIAALREAMNKAFADMGAKMDFHLGAIRAEMTALKAVPPEKQGIPVRWIAIGGLVLVGVIAAVAYGIGFASNASHFRAVADGLASQ